MKLHGIFPPSQLRSTTNGEIYKAKVQHNVEKWNMTGLAGYVVCGSTGESVMLTTGGKDPDVGDGWRNRRARTNC